jgi:hypothetical protein
MWIRKKGIEEDMTEVLEKGTDLLEDAVDCFICIDIYHFFFLLKLANHLKCVLSICPKPFFDYLWIVVTAALL